MGSIADQLTADAKPRVEVAKVCVDGELYSRINQLYRQYREEKTAPDADLAGSGVSREIEELLDQAEEHTYHFKFKAIGTDRWKRLKDRHPPKKEDVKEAVERKERPPEVRGSFWAEAIAESLAAVKKASDSDDAWESVDWDEDGVREVTAAWNDAQFAELQLACRSANEAGSQLPGKGSAFARMLNGDERSERPEPSDGLDRSSTGGG